MKSLVKRDTDMSPSPQNTQLVDELESLVRGGEFDKVAKILKGLTPKNIERASARQIANVAIRVNRPLLALRILNPIVRAEAHSMKEAATALEKIEYAEALRKLGGAAEARQILAEIDGTLHPQALLGLAFCNFSEWRYDDALPLLERYVKSDSITDYQRTVGKVNLLAALNHQALFEQAEPLASELRRETKEKNYGLLHGNSLELSAVLELSKETWARAHSYLDEAAAFLNQGGQPVALWIKKWKAIVESQELKAASPALYAICEQAVASEHWETVRDCQSHIARLNRDPERLARVFFGTCHDGYRRDLARRTASWFEPQPFYLFGAEGAPITKILDVLSGSLDGVAKESGLPTGQLEHRLLVVLSRDFFRPFPLVTLFANLFPDEHFNPFSSPDRIHQALKLLRAWINEQQLPLAVVEKNGSYRLVPGGGLGLRVPRERPVPDSKELQLALLLTRLGRREFSVQEATRAMGASTSTTQRLLRWAVGIGKLSVSGAGPKTRYSPSPRPRPTDRFAAA